MYVCMYVISAHTRVHVCSILRMTYVQYLSYMYVFTYHSLHTTPTCIANLYRGLFPRGQGRCNTHFFTYGNGSSMRCGGVCSSVPKMEYMWVDFVNKQVT